MLLMRACTPFEVPEGYQLFNYKDKDTKSLSHMLDLHEYGVPLEDQMSEVVVLDVLEPCRCVFIHFFVLK
jgi:hypothetical protein